MSDPVYAQRDGAIATVALNRPERMNALDKAMWMKLGAVMRELDADDSVRCVVLRGAGGKAFAAGADIREFANERDNAAQARRYGEDVAGTMRALAECRHPTLALIEGAAEGAGLGIRFLKHLQRTRLLLHLVDIAPPDPDADPVKDARAIAGELRKFSPALAKRARWLVLNKLDLLDAEEGERRCREIVRRLRWKGNVFRISGVTGQGTRELVQAVMTHLETLAKVSRV